MNTFYLKFSPYTYLRETARPVFLGYVDGDTSVPGRDISHSIHHPMFGIKVKQAMDALGCECWLEVDGKSFGTQKKYDHYVDFLTDKLVGDRIAKG